jgi:hypothetical protein
LPTSTGVPTSSEYAQMMNLIVAGKSFEDGVAEAGFPDNEIFRDRWEQTKQGIEEDEATDGGPANWIDHDGTE